MEEVVKHEENYTVRHGYTIRSAVVDKMGMFAGFLSEVVYEDVPVCDRIVLSYRDGNVRDVHRRRHAKYDYKNDRTKNMMKSLKSKARSMGKKLYGAPIHEPSVIKNKAIDKKFTEIIRTYKKKIRKGEKI